jgi:hypothetical protein
VFADDCTVLYCCAGIRELGALIETLVLEQRFKLATLKVMQNGGLHMKNYENRCKQAKQACMQCNAMQANKHSLNIN